MHEKTSVLKILFEAVNNVHGWKRNRHTSLLHASKEKNMLFNHAQFSLNILHQWDF